MVRTADGQVDNGPSVRAMTTTAYYVDCANGSRVLRTHRENSMEPRCPSSARSGRASS